MECTYLIWFLNQSCQLSRIERETHAFHPISPESHAYYANISRPNFFVFFFVACQRFVMYEGYPFYVPAMWKWLPKFLRSPPPLIIFFGTCATFIGCQRTGLAYLTPNPHPKLAALLNPFKDCCSWSWFYYQNISLLFREKWSGFF